MIEAIEKTITSKQLKEIEILINNYDFNFDLTDERIDFNEFVLSNNWLMYVDGSMSIKYKIDIDIDVYIENISFYNESLGLDFNLTKNQHKKIEELITIKIKQL